VFEGILGLLVWLVANGLYIDMKRRGRRGFGRVVLFFMGLPLTFLWLVVPEGRDPELQSVPDDTDDLLAEIRRDRALRDGDPARLEEPAPGDAGLPPS
jgi:hypothetical protein